MTEELKRYEVTVHVVLDVVMRISADSNTTAEYRAQRDLKNIFRRELPNYAIHGMQVGEIEQLGVRMTDESQFRGDRTEDKVSE